LYNVPEIRDVSTQLAILRDLGVRTQAGEDGALTLDTRSLDGDALPHDLGRAIRGSFLLAPGLLNRNGSAALPRPGGDRIGRRRIDTHISVLRELGAEVETDERQYRLRLRNGFRGADIFLDEASVMATENAVMAAAVATGKTRIANAASEPHVQGLCRQLVAMGAKIEGIGTNMLSIEGRRELCPATHRIGPDHIEIGSFVAIAAMTGGELRVRDVAPDDLRMIQMVFARLGARMEIEGDQLFVPAKQDLVIRDDLDGAIPKVDDAPWPGFPSDLTSIALVLATQARGTVLIHEKMFENRLFFVDRLISMGARVILCDPHRAVVSGPTRLQGDTLSSPDIRAGMALVAAALCAEGRSVIMNASQVDRGYQDIDERLRALGADISRIS
ncbi:MAG: UDP-N-acetylglucosamine 1-carboxyvinyltransferase, partial [Myxococcales bacterium]|nr:UDP-N-acetylglucosamine 1-carboxyvinyltransferase [Myxococcales bacterium]